MLALVCVCINKHGDEEAGSITSFFPILGRKSKRACPKRQKLKK